MSGMNEHLLNFKGLMIDEVQRVIIRENQEIELTYTEFEILKLFAKHPGIVFSKEQIYDIVWKESYSGDYNIVMSHIRNIRFDFCNVLLSPFCTCHCKCFYK